MSRAPRILLGTVEICRNLYDLAEGFRQLGYEVGTVMELPNPQHPDLRYDFSLHPPIFPDKLNNIRNPIIRYPRAMIQRSYRLMRLVYFLRAYDVYIFQFGGSLLPGNKDYPLLKRLGKKIIALFQGSDIRHWSALEPVRRSFGLKAYSWYQEMRVPLCQKLITLRMAERYADAIFTQPSIAELAVRPYMHLYLAVNLTLYECSVPGRDVPVVIHAPSRRETKGTKEILATLERLRSEGIAFELRLLEGVPNKEVIRQLVDADVVIDELNEANYGMLALEAMATGCAVAGGNHPGLVPLPPDRPILHIQPATVYAQLRKLLTDKPLRIQLALAGRPFVEKYHDYLNVARGMLKCLTPNQGHQYDYYPSFFARDYHVPENESISDDLKSMTAQIVQRWGLPEDVDPQDMIARGLMSADGFNSSRAIAHWKSSNS